MSGSRINKVSNTFGAIEIVAHDRETVVLSVTARNYDVGGCLHTDRACARLSLGDAYRLHAALASAIVAAEESNVRQPGFWSDATICAAISRPHGWRAAS